MRVQRGDRVILVDLRLNERTTVVVESVDGDHAVVRPVNDVGRWRVSTAFLAPIER
jgi:hypothetical protein